MHRVRKSLIPGAGKGLFASCDIPEGEPVCQYGGRYVTTAPNLPEADYSVQLQGQELYIVASDPQEPTQGRWINCAPSREQINCEFVEYDNDEVWMLATRNVRKGEELLAWYGSEYGTELVGRDIMQE